MGSILVDASALTVEFVCLPILAHLHNWPCVGARRSAGCSVGCLEESANCPSADIVRTGLGTNSPGRVLRWGPCNGVKESRVVAMRCSTMVRIPVLNGWGIHIF